MDVGEENFQIVKIGVNAGYCLTLQCSSIRIVEWMNLLRVYRLS